MGCVVGIPGGGVYGIECGSVFKNKLPAAVGTSFKEMEGKSLRERCIAAIAQLPKPGGCTMLVDKSASPALHPWLALHRLCLWLADCGHLLSGWKNSALQWQRKMAIVVASTRSRSCQQCPSKLRHCPLHSNLVECWWPGG